MEKPSNDVMRFIVLLIALGINIVDQSKSIISIVNNTYKLSWFKQRKLRNTFKTEIFNWSWAVSSLMGFILIKNKQLDNEAYLYIDILDDYIKLTSSNIIIENYESWKQLIGKELEITENEWNGKITINEHFKQRLLDVPPRLLSLKIIKHIKKGVLLDTDELNKNWKEQIYMVQIEIEDCLYMISEIIRKYLEESNDEQIKYAYKAVCNQKPFVRLIKMYSQSHC